MIKAIIFDCFGVLVTSTYEPFKKKYFGDNVELIQQFTKIEDRSSRGEITLDEAVTGFAELANISFEQAYSELINNPRNADLLAYISGSLKDNYKIGFLSNASKDRLVEMFTPDDIALFDDILLSFQVGLAKPDPQIFKLSAQRLGVESEECLFVDDLSKYLVGAEQAGMKSILYTSFEEFKIELEKVLNEVDS